MRGSVGGPGVTVADYADSQLDEMQYTMDVLARDLRAKFNIPEPAPRSLTTGESADGKDGAHAWAAKRVRRRPAALCFCSQCW